MMSEQAHQYMSHGNMFSTLLFLGEGGGPQLTLNFVHL